MTADANMPASMSAVKLALAARRLRVEGGGADPLQSEPIAVIGIGCRLPGGADSPDDFWRVLESGTDAIREIPPTRWDIDAYYDPNPRTPAKMSTRWAGLLDQLDLFDAEFFGIAPREAASMDPQQRLLLEVTWEALNDAGHPPESLGGTATGVFFAIYNSDYSRLLFQDVAHIDGHASSGTAHGIAAGRISYLLNLHGPSMAVDTACSSSLVAVHLACQSLRTGECSLAVAGGANVLITPEETIALSKWGMLAPDGRCKTFDAAANGFVRGEGCGVIILKRLADALADGDPIHGLIRGTAVNQDGRSTVLTAPNGLAQQAVLRQALKNARLEPRQISYVETHGTGTALGDPIEVEALGATVGVPRPDETTCRLGSVKTNFGHLEAAAGIAGLIKVLLSMRHGKIPPHLHFKKLNPLISLDGTCLVIEGESAQWPASAAPRCAGVSSFGFGGTNAHIVLEEPPRVQSGSERSATARSWLLPLSARDRPALLELAGRMEQHLMNPQAGARTSLADLCYTASVRRWHFPARAALVGTTLEELVEKLREYRAAPPRSVATPLGGKPGKLAFIFSGHGSQWLGMGRNLLEREPVFRVELEKCDVVVRAVSGWSVLEALAAPEGRSRLDDTEVFQPALFAVQTALAALWRSWGIAPDALIGHSVGEIAAAHLSQAITLETAVTLAVLRGRLMGNAPTSGAMAAVEIAAADAKPLIARLALDLTVAAINAPGSITLSGAPEAIDAAVTALVAQGISARRLSVNRAFHSPVMIPCADELRQQLRSLQASPNVIPFFSTVDGRLRDGRTLDAAYWALNVREPVLFAAALESAIQAGCSTFLEIGPHPVLAGALQQCVAATGKPGLVLGSMRRGQDEQTTMLAACGALYTAGRGIDWKLLYGNAGRCVSLPTYPWQRERHWLEVAKRDDTSADFSEHAAVPEWPGRATRSAFFAGLILEGEISAEKPEFIDHHRICGVATVPATAMIDLALACAQTEFECERPGYVVIDNLAIDQALTLADGERRAIQAGFKASDPQSGTFQLFSRAACNDSAGKNWTLHASGSVQFLAAAEIGQAGEVQTPTLDDARQQCPMTVDVAAHYQHLRASGLEFGPRFRRMERLWRGPEAGLARIGVAANDAVEAATHVIDPTLLDACLQAVTAAFPQYHADSSPSHLYLPVSVQRACLAGSLDAARWSFARLRKAEERADGTVVADIWIFADSGERLGWFKGLLLRRTERVQLEQILRLDNGSLYELAWEPKNLPDGQTPIGRCLILADRLGIARSLADALTACGTECITATHADSFRGRDGHYELAADKSADFRALLKDLQLHGRWPVAHVVHCWGMDVPPASPTATGKLVDAQLLSCGSVLHLLQTLSVEAGLMPPRVWILTRQSVSSGASSAAVEPTQSPLQGFARVAALEHPEFRCTTVDISCDKTTATLPIQGMVAELRGNDGSENQVALAGRQRLVARLRRMAPRSERYPATPTAYANVALRPPASGVLEALAWTACPRRLPTAGEVEIEVAYAGLNFRDVLTALKVVAGAPDQLGAECAGRVVAVGDTVRDLNIGDEVIAFALGGLKSFVTVPASLVARKPAGLTIEQAAALPVIFLTALYAFRRLTSLRAGQKVLIHAAAGGVGCAAVQLARLAGAKIFATVSSPEKRALVKSWGAHHILNSRTLEFADEIQSITGGAGIDLVLNSLTGEFASRSLALVRPGGVFIELGKRDLLDPQTVARTHPGVRYAAFDIAEIAKQDPAVIQSLLVEMNTLLAAHQVQPPPTALFQAADVGVAFRHMAQGRHVGKIVISMESTRPANAERNTGGNLPDGAYLITGGLGALGLHLARWLIARGAARVALLGRREPDRAATAVVEELRAAGVRVEIYAVDVSDRAALQQALERVRQELGALRGLVHAAGVLDDATIDQLTWARCERVFAPKIDGSWNLHALTCDDPLEFFVLFSSVASTLGWSGQANYAAANAFLDALAHYRRALGLPAVSINWGPWAGTGMAANMSGRDRERLASRGFKAMSVEEGLQALDRIVEHGAPQVLAVSADWLRYAEQFPGQRAPAQLQHLVRRARTVPATGSAAGDAAPDFAAELALLPAMQRWPRIVAFVERHAARALGLAPGRPVNAQRPLHDLGLDSLLSVELRNALAASLGTRLSATLLFDYPTVETLARHLAKEVLKCEVDLGTNSQAAGRNQALEDLKNLSDEEAEASLLRELERTEQ